MASMRSFRRSAERAWPRMVGAGPLLDALEGAVDGALEAVGGFEPFFGEGGEGGEFDVSCGGVAGGGSADFAHAAQGEAFEVGDDGGAGEHGRVDREVLHTLVDLLGELEGVAGEFGGIVADLGEEVAVGVPGAVDGFEALPFAELLDVGAVLQSEVPVDDGLLDFEEVEVPGLDVVARGEGDLEGAEAALLPGGDDAGDEVAVFVEAVDEAPAGGGVLFSGGPHLEILRALRKGLPSPAVDHGGGLQVGLLGDGLREGLRGLERFRHGVPFCLVWVIPGWRCWRSRRRPRCRGRCRGGWRRGFSRPGRSRAGWRGGRG